MESLNKSKFVTAVMYSDPVVQDESKTSSVDFQILQQDVQRFVLVQGDQYFEATDLDKIMEDWNYFQKN